ncbi:hypothetical protein B0187_02830 [Haemophilus paracuniculus]|uniref:C-type lysozyme inhibitor domain-containing protein n=1 Tax=Haemophilus paracuniculus TaxID=734 RepID=A0A1T0ASY2_9PAST|nr:MliC family protein [Haemophilus paracuniculus]OOR99759.1 hypothetical protein B0187_02830 [Haemophilus paracuniculus]
MKKFYAVALFSAVMLSGCANNPLVPPPVEQMQNSVEPAKKTQTKNRVSVSRHSVEYQCKGDKVVRVQQAQPKKTAKKVSKAKSITVTFGKSTHTLSATVNQRGNQYSNIRWNWIENLNGYATLRDNSGKILAENCKVKK